MAVDANILIFERMKEELRAGRSMASALDAGFARAWTSIRDSNVSTLITCMILYWFGATFGASIIQGFALTLALGVVVSMFTAITVTRTFLRALQEVGAMPLHGALGLTPRPAHT
jgi:preprotein translocase subunit SecD